MTEAEWLASPDPQAMLDVVSDEMSDRKLRLFAVACCHRLGINQNQNVRHLVEVAEKYSDGLAPLVDLRAAHSAARAYFDRCPAWSIEQEVAEAVERTLWHPAREEAALAAAAAARVPAYAPRLHSGWDEERYLAECLWQSRVLRCIVGPLQFSVRLNPSWLSHVVVRLAEAIYAERDFVRLPILGDALEEAGCTNQDVLEHCRGPAVHCRGCWVIDLLLNKE